MNVAKKFFLSEPLISGGGKVYLHLHKTNAFSYWGSETFSEQKITGGLDASSERTCICPCLFKVE